MSLNDERREAHAYSLLGLLLRSGLRAWAQRIRAEPQFKMLRPHRARIFVAGHILGFGVSHALILQKTDDLVGVLLIFLPKEPQLRAGRHSIHSLNARNVE